MQFCILQGKMLPIMEGFLMDPVKEANQIDKLMNYIGKNVANIKITESILATAVKVKHFIPS